MKLLRRLDAWETRHPVIAEILKAVCAIVGIPLTIAAAYGWSLIVR